jgi:hypothetical protein
MQIGSAMTYAAPLPSSLAARTPSPELSRPADPTVQPQQASAESIEPRDQAQSPARADAAGEDESPRETQQLRQEQLEVAELVSRDREVRAHEQAHASVGGAYAGAPTYTFKRGPDGKSYAVSGEVGIDTSPIPGDPEATLRKMELVQRAALAPAEPSVQDLRVAAEAAAQATQARGELGELRREEAIAAAEERAARREERLAEEEDKAQSEEEEKPQQLATTPPRLELYLRLAQLQAPPPAVDLQV